MVSVKVAYCREVRRFSLDDPVNVSFPEFKAKIATLFNKDETQADKMQLRYQDKDGDSVSVSSSEELLEALRQRDGDTARFYVEEPAADTWWSGQHFKSPHSPSDTTISGGCPFLASQGGAAASFLQQQSCPFMAARSSGNCPFLAQHGNGGFKQQGESSTCPFLTAHGNGEFKNRGSSNCPFLTAHGKGGFKQQGSSTCPFLSAHGQGGFKQEGSSTCPFIAAHGNGGFKQQGSSTCPFISAHSNGGFLTKMTGEDNAEEDK